MPVAGFTGCHRLKTPGDREIDDETRPSTGSKSERPCRVEQEREGGRSEKGSLPRFEAKIIKVQWPVNEEGPAKSRLKGGRTTPLGKKGIKPYHSPS